MELEKIIEALSEKEVGAEIIEAIKGLADTSAVDTLKRELEAERGKVAGVLEDKKKFKERAEEAEKQLKKIADSKLSDSELAERKLAELEEKLQQSEAERQKEHEAFEAKQREARLSDITGSIRWADGVPRDTAKLIVSRAFNDADLDDKSKVETIIKEITQTHKSFITAETPAGGGGKGGDGGGAPGADRPATMTELMEEVWGAK